MITPADTLVYNVGQKVTFYSTVLSGVWSLDPSTEITEDSVSTIESTGLVTNDAITYNYCKVRFKYPGTFFIRLDSDTFTTSIYGLDTHWVSKQTSLWSNDVGTLCTGLVNSVQKINKWSLAKPIRSAETNILSQENFQENGAGMDISRWSGLGTNTSLLDFLSNIATSWEYLYPRGSEYSEYYRLTDFLGYTKQKNTNSIIHTEGNTLYNLNVSTIYTKSNEEVYAFEKVISDQVLNFSDIWLTSDSLNNIGEYYLMVLATDGTRHFLKSLKKLSELESFTIEPTLQNLYNTYYSGNIFSVKDTLTRYYFFGDATSLFDWEEVFDNSLGQAPINYIPGYISKGNKPLLNYFTNALNIPLDLGNNIIQNNIIVTTSMPTIIKNSSGKFRYMSFDIRQKNGILGMSYDKSFNSLESVSLELEGITSEDEGVIDFYNSYNTDAIYWDIGNTGVYDGWFRPSLGSTDISIQFNEILSSVSETLWHQTQNKIVLIKEDIFLNFLNEGTQDITIQLMDFGDGKILPLSPSNSSLYLNDLNNTYTFINLNQYNFKIYSPNISTLNTVIENGSDIRFNSFTITPIDDYLLVSFILNLENGSYDDTINPLSINITITP